METPPKKELLMKMLELDESHARLKQEMCRLKAVSTEHGHPVSPAKRNIDQGALALRNSCANSLPRERSISLRARVGGGAGPSTARFTHQQYLNIVQSMGQSVHAIDLEMRIIFWNAMAEKQFGYSAAEAVGQNPINVMVDDQDAAFAMNIVQCCFNGDTWTGEFPLRSKSGHRFLAVTTCSPFYDDAGSLVGFIALTSNAVRYLHPSISLAKVNAKQGEKNSSPVSSFVSKLGLESKGAVSSKLGIDSHQHVQAAMASEISDLACKVSNKVMLKTRGGDSMENRALNGSRLTREQKGKQKMGHEDEKPSQQSNSSVPEFKSTAQRLCLGNEDKNPKVRNMTKACNEGFNGLKLSNGFLALAHDFDICLGFLAFTLSVLLLILVVCLNG